MNEFVKGRTNNHLSWIMVDATDFATPESALSAATKIKIWGKLRGATGVNFVTSGTGSLTNDIQHIGPSVLGFYTIALAKADLSDASAAWYDAYYVSLSATGAAYQALVVDGGIDASAILAATALTQSMASDAASAAQQANSRVLVVQSQASDAYSAIIAPLASMTSDVASAVWAHAIGARVDSRILVGQSFLSDIRSHVSDLQSDFQSRVPKAVATNSQLSDLHSDLRSYLVVMSAVQSDLYSAVSDLQSDFQSRVPKRVATDSQLSDLASDVKSAVAAITVTVTASDMSDIASLVWATAEGAAVSSRVLVAQSYLSDIRSHVSDLQSDFQSRVPKRVATDSQLSDMASDVKSAVAVGNSRVLVVQSQASDLASKLSDVESNLLSVLGTTGVQLNASSLSDLRSAITAVAPTLSASDISDIASAVAAAFTLTVSAMSDIASQVWAHTTGAALSSRVLVAQSYLSDIRSHVSDLQSDFQSRVPKAVATNSQLSDLASDLKSHLTVSSSVQSDIYSLLATVPTAAQNADKLLGRTIAGSADGGRMVKDALRAGRNKVSISGTTMTVYAEDDTTPAWTATITREAADAIKSIDPP